VNSGPAAAQGLAVRLSPSESRQRARIGAHASWAATADPSARTAPGRAAARRTLDARLCEQYGLDPGGDDFAKRLEHARRAYFAKLALRGATARRKAAGR
jgi:hypothetical protein